MNELDSKEAHAARDASVERLTKHLEVEMLATKGEEEMTSDDYVFADGNAPEYLITPLVRVTDGHPEFEPSLGRWATSSGRAIEAANEASQKDGCMYFVFEVATTVGPMETLLTAVTGSEVIVSHREIYRTAGRPMSHTIVDVF